MATQKIRPDQISIDAPPASPNAKDDEFDGSSSVTWTSTPTAPNAWSINGTSPGRAYLKASGSSATIVGKYQAMPASFPYTITTKIRVTTGRADYHRCGGIALWGASPTGSSPLTYIGPIWQSNNGMQRYSYSAPGTGTGGSSRFTCASGLIVDHYLKVVVTAVRAVTWSYSVDGEIWLVGETGFVPGYDIVNAGPAMSEESSGGGVEALFDFFRVT